METKIITDIDAFMEDWNKAQSTLTERGTRHHYIRSTPARNSYQAGETV